MKKRISRVLLALTLSASMMLPTASAAFDPGTNWGWVASNDKVSVYHDRNTIVYTSSVPYQTQDIATLWLCTIKPEANTYTKSQVRIYKNANTVQTLSSTVYDSATDAVLSTGGAGEPMTIAPGSIEETYLYIIFPR